MISGSQLSSTHAWGRRALNGAAGLVFCAVLVVAPLNFGSTRAGGSEIIAAGCLFGTLLWAMAQWGRRPHVALPRAAVMGAALLTIAAIPWLGRLASPTPVDSFTQTHFAHVAARWPSSIVWRTPANTLLLILALAAAIFPLIDLARSPAWTVSFSVAITATGVAVAILALAQNYTHATGIYWRDDGRLPGNFCGTFYHHTAAGAYFNTAWPLAFALATLAWSRAASHPSFRFWAGAGLFSVIVLVAAHGSHVSRFPQVAALLVAPLLLSRLKIGGRLRWLFAAGGTIAVIFLVVVAGRTGDIRARWQLMFTPVETVVTSTLPTESAWPSLIRDDLFIPHTSRGGWLGDRGEGWRTALRSMAARPLTGHGPGNWMGAASKFSTDPFVRTFFQFLQFTHQDLLQFAVEWGVPAAIGWWTLLAGALVAAARTRTWLSPLHRSLGIAAACGLGAVLLQAMGDFPLEMPAVLLNVVVLSALVWASVSQPSPALAFVRHDR